MLGTLLIAGMAVLLAGCSTTSAIPEGEQLFTGLKRIDYVNFEKNDHATATQEEMNYVLATVPNGALLGSSFHRNPFQLKLRIWNAFSQSDTPFAKWMTRAFGAKPKLMSAVNPALRTQVAASQLKKYGYFHGKVSYEEVKEKNPKKGKISYKVDMGPLWRLDSIRYVNFPASTDSLMQAHMSQTLIHRGDAFDVPTLENERQRIARLFRNNGYYYYQNSYASYLADTLGTPQRVQLRLQMADSLDAAVRQQWHIGNVEINYRQNFTDTLLNEERFRRFTNRFNGRRPPIRPGVVFGYMKLRPRQLYSADGEQQTNLNLQNTGLFSYHGLRFTPRDSSATCDTLDMAIDLVFDKRYDFYVEANAKGKTSGQLGPELVLGFTKRNAFRGGEKLDINLHGSYEWQTGHKAEGSSSKINSYDYGGDISLVLPRLLTPRSILTKQITRIRRNSGRPYRPRFYTTPTTTLKASSNVLNRAGYFKRHVVSGELTYDFWTSASSHHSFSPLMLSYEYMTSQTDAFTQLVGKNPYLQVSMQDQFVPKMSYSYEYNSAAKGSNPITWKTTLSEGGNLLALGYTLGGYRWNERNKQMFKNPFAQFVKLETDIVKLWQVADHSQLVAHANAGIIKSYGNSTQAPYYEQFYVGGANSIRAFNVRSIGPGKYVPGNSKMSYIEQTGDVKLLANLEYRTRLFGSLNGAVFLDAGNVWTLRHDEHREGAKLELKNVLAQMAVGTGIGLRYDMELFVIRIDWGIGLHVPYATGRSGFYNIPSFGDGQSLHLAIGYPF